MPTLRFLASRGRSSIAPALTPLSSLLSAPLSMMPPKIKGVARGVVKARVIKVWLERGFACKSNGQCQWFGGKLNLEETSYMWSLPFGLPPPPWPTIAALDRVRHWTAGWNIVVGGG